MSKFPKRLKTLRKETIISQKKLSDFLGYKYTAVANYESGRNEPSIDTLIKIASYFGVTTDYLVGVSDFPQKEKDLSAKESNLLLIFRNLPTEKQDILLKLVSYLS